MRGDTSIDALPAEAAFVLLSFLDTVDWGRAALANRRLWAHVRALLAMRRGCWFASSARAQAHLARTSAHVRHLRTIHRACVSTGPQVFRDCIRLVSRTASVSRDTMVTLCDKGEGAYERLRTLAQAHHNHQHDPARVHVPTAQLGLDTAGTRAMIHALSQEHDRCAESLDAESAARHVLLLLLGMTVETWTQAPRSFERLLRTCRSIVREVLLTIDANVFGASRARFPLLAGLRDVPTRSAPAAYPTKYFVPPTITSHTAMVANTVQMVRSKLGRLFNTSCDSLGAFDYGQPPGTFIYPGDDRSIHIVYYLTTAQLNHAMIWGERTRFSLSRLRDGRAFAPLTAQ
jgi:hypothetical protein